MEWQVCDNGSDLRRDVGLGRCGCKSGICERGSRRILFEDLRRMVARPHRCGHGQEREGKAAGPVFRARARLRPAPQGGEPERVAVAVAAWRALRGLQLLDGPMASCGGREPEGLHIARLLCSFARRRCVRAGDAGGGWHHSAPTISRRQPSPRLHQSSHGMARRRSGRARGHRRDPELGTRPECGGERGQALDVRPRADVERR
mmetsp:Transcript_79877/g.171183  ORF Transcript_79877/g.171183 Transcript_79877/m.171183 type:complete len:204 (-) Transcript_79877:563-1174(-)